MLLRSVAALLALSTMACVTVRPVATPASFIPQRSPDLVWVTAQSGEVIPIAGPHLRGDTLSGKWFGTSDSVSVQLPELRMVYARQPDRTRTAWLIATATAFAGFVVWRAIRSGNGTTNCVYEPGPGWTCQ